MDYAPSPDRRATTPPVPVKIIVAGGFGVGKTTTVGAISEIAPLTTEAEMTMESVGVDDPGPTGKTTTTIAMDWAGLPFAVGVNTFDGQLGHNLDEVRWALALRDDTPVVQFDARFRASVRDALLVVLDQALRQAVRRQRT